MAMLVCPLPLKKSVTRTLICLCESLAPPPFSHGSSGHGHVGLPFTTEEIGHKNTDMSLWELGTTSLFTRFFSSGWEQKQVQASLGIPSQGHMIFPGTDLVTCLCMCLTENDCANTTDLCVVTADFSKLSGLAVEISLLRLVALQRHPAQRRAACKHQTQAVSSQVLSGQCVTVNTTHAVSSQVLCVQCVTVNRTHALCLRAISVAVYDSKHNPYCLFASHFCGSVWQQTQPILFVCEPFLCSVWQWTQPTLFIRKPFPCSVRQQAQLVSK